MTPGLVAPAEEQAWNEAALGERVTAPVVRVWTYARPAVVLGRGQRQDPEVESRARAAGIELCGRISGGGAVLAGPWLLGASVVLPPEHPLVIPNLRASYGWIGRAHARWLAALGIAARVADRKQERGLEWACFGGLSYGELAVGERKIVGLAQARRRTGVLLSAGTLILRTPWDVLSAVMGRRPEDARALELCTTSCAETLGRAAPLADLASALQAVLAEATS